VTIYFNSAVVGRRVISIVLLIFFGSANNGVFKQPEGQSSVDLLGF
jgi:hypothetical protein